MRSGRLIFFGEKSAAENRFDAENIEIVSGNEKAPSALVVAVVAQAGNDNSVNEQSGKDVVSIAVVLVIQVRLKGEISAVMQRAVDFDQLRRLLHRQWPEQNSVNKAKDRSVRAYAERKRNDRENGERRMFEQLANTVANVAKQRFHVDWMQCQRDLDSQTFGAPHKTAPLFFVEMA